MNPNVIFTMIIVFCLTFLYLDEPEGNECGDTVTQGEQQ